MNVPSRAKTLKLYDGGGFGSPITGRPWPGSLELDDGTPRPAHVPQRPRRAMGAGRHDPSRRKGASRRRHPKRRGRPASSARRGGRCTERPLAADAACCHARRRGACRTDAPAEVRCIECGRRPDPGERWSLRFAVSARLRSTAPNATSGSSAERSHCGENRDVVGELRDGAGRPSGRGRVGHS